MATYLNIKKLTYLDIKMHQRWSMCSSSFGLAGDLVHRIISYTRQDFLHKTESHYLMLLSTDSLESLVQEAFS